MRATMLALSTEELYSSPRQLKSLGTRLRTPVAIEDESNPTALPTPHTDSSNVDYQLMAPKPSFTWSTSLSEEGCQCFFFRPALRPFHRADRLEKQRCRQTHTSTSRKSECQQTVRDDGETTEAQEGHFKGLVIAAYTTDIAYIWRWRDVALRASHGTKDQVRTTYYHRC